MTISVLSDKIDFVFEGEAAFVIVGELAMCVAFLVLFDALLFGALLFDAGAFKQSEEYTGLFVDKAAHKIVSASAELDAARGTMGLASAARKASETPKRMEGKYIILT